MLDLTAPRRKLNIINAMSDEHVQRVRNLEAMAQAMDQVPIETTHSFHAGMYARTIKIPQGVTLTGAFITIPTLLIASGEGAVFTEQGTELFNGYNVFQCEANRKQAFIAITDVYLTMIFKTDATTIDEAEAEFTNEAHLLLTNQKGN